MKPSNDEVSPSQNMENSWRTTPFSRNMRTVDVYIRRIFWGLGLSMGVVVAYLTRYYVNGDAITYFDMAAAFRSGEWVDAVNLTYSPGYPILLALMGFILKNDNYLFLAKGLNLFSFIVAMGACDLFVSQAYKSLQDEFKRRSLPGPVFTSICYAAFLLSSMGWIRLQVVSPDMMVFALLLVCSTVLIKITSNPEKFSLYGVLGLMAGLGYVFKTFFFPFSGLFFLMAVCWNRRILPAILRLSFALGAMLIISSPVLITQSLVAGKFSYGEAGTYNYSYFVAGQGERIHSPEVLHQSPLVLSYDRGKITTYPKGADLAYWNMGIKPAMNLKAQFSAILESLDHLFGRIFLPTIAFMAWFLVQWRRNGLVRPYFFPPSVPVMLAIISLSGTFMFCLVVMEIRYVAPFVFLGFVALASLPKRKAGEDGKSSRDFLDAGILVTVLLTILIQSVVDQSLRCMQTIDSKKSHYDLFLETKAVSDFLNSNGVSTGDRIAIILPFSQRLYFANLAGARITAEFPDTEEFLKSTPESRSNAMEALRKAGIKSIVGANPALIQGSEMGWKSIHGAPNHFAIILNPESKNSNGH